MFQGVIFDMDGTVVDSEALYYQLACRILKNRGFFLPRDVFIATSGVSRAEGARIYTQAFPGLDGEGDVMDALDEAYGCALQNGQLELKPGFLSLAGQLKEKNIPMVLASSNIPSAVERTLMAVGLTDTFDYVIHAGHVERVKPYPDLFLKAAQCMKLRPEQCLVLEDSEPGVLAAAAAGMKVILIPDIYPVSCRMEQLCERVVGSLEDVKVLFK